MEIERIEISLCCEADTYEDEEDREVCCKCKKVCSTKMVCAYCMGTGEVTVDEQVYPGEPHTAPIGTEKCVCQMNFDE